MPMEHRQLMAQPLDLGVLRHCPWGGCTSLHNATDQAVEEGEGHSRSIDDLSWLVKALAGQDTVRVGAPFRLEASRRPVQAQAGGGWPPSDSHEVSTRGLGEGELTQRT